MSLTPEQKAQRLGLLTASKAPVVMGGLKTDGLEKYVRQVAGERVYGDLGEEGFHNDWMDRGSEMENPALDWFEFQTEETLERQAFRIHPDVPTAAATPDALGARWTVEAKSPSFHIWCDTREALQRGQSGLEAVPSGYRWQCRWQCWCCGVPEGRFVVWHPASGGLIIPFVVDSAYFEQMAARVRVVEGLISNWVDILRSKP